MSFRTGTPDEQESPESSGIHSPSERKMVEYQAREMVKKMSDAAFFEGALSRLFDELMRDPALNNAIEDQIAKDINDENYEAMMNQTRGSIQSNLANAFQLAEGAPIENIDPAGRRLNLLTPQRRGGVIRRMFANNPELVKDYMSTVKNMIATMREERVQAMINGWNSAQINIITGQNPE